jgi:hypothetical protein
LALFWSTEMIALGCIGAINLFSMTCAPLIPLSLLGVFHHAVALNYSRQWINPRNSLNLLLFPVLSTSKPFKQ